MLIPRCIAGEYTQMPLFNTHGWFNKIACCNRMQWSKACTHELLHAQMQLYIRHSGINVLSFKHSFNMFHHIINSNHGCRSKMDKFTYLMKSLIHNQLRRCNVPPNHRLVCSLISQQRSHPRAGHDSPRNKGTSRLTHSQGYANTAKPTQLGLSGHSGVG